MADIELVIKIPTAIYEASQILDVKYEDTIQIPLEVIANGTPLPKGHGRLADKDRLANRIKKYVNTVGFDTSTLAMVIEMIYGEPTVIDADRE